MSVQTRKKSTFLYKHIEILHFESNWEPDKAKMNRLLCNLMNSLDER